MDNQKWHYFTMYGKEYLVLGYNPDKNLCLVFCISDLHLFDQEHLSYIVDSEAAQKEAYLLVILSRQPSPINRGTWWNYLMEKTDFISLELLTNSLDSTQIEVFRADHKTKKQKELLEDAIIINHIGREDPEFISEEDYEIGDPSAQIMSVDEVIYSKI